MNWEQKGNFKLALDKLSTEVWQTFHKAISYFTFTFFLVDSLVSTPESFQWLCTSFS